ncbi:MAG TPA: hypothetical protein VGD80_42945 [Kofleriaceae bacterium]
MMKMIAVIAAATLAACTESVPEAPTLPATAEVDTATLAAHSLTVNSLPEMRLLATAEGRDVLSRVVSCALPSGASITAITSSGTPYSFTGKVGLAPSWAQRAATAHERSRVTACVLGRAIEPGRPALASDSFTRV